MFRKVITVLLLSFIILLQGCTTTQGQKEQAGMVIGGVLGGLLGGEVGDHRHTAAIIAGTLIGAAIGGAVGQSMDETDRLRTAQTLESVRTGVPSTWQNPDTGSQYSVTPTRTWYTNGAPCREFTMQALIGGKKETIYGTACRQPDGSWKIQS